MFSDGKKPSVQWTSDRPLPCDALWVVIFLSQACPCPARQPPYTWYLKGWWNLFLLSQDRVRGTQMWPQQKPLSWTSAPKFNIPEESGQIALDQEPWHKQEIGGTSRGVQNCKTVWSIRTSNKSPNPGQAHWDPTFPKVADRWHLTRSLGKTKDLTGQSGIVLSCETVWSLEPLAEAPTLVKHTQKSELPEGSRHMELNQES